MSVHIRVHTRVQVRVGGDDDPIQIAKQQAPPGAYTETPVDEITLDYAERMVFDRINLHHCLDRANRDAVTNLMRRQAEILAGSMCMANAKTDSDSFFLLMLIMSGHHKARSWWFSAETRLVHARLKFHTPARMMRTLNLRAELVTIGDQNQIPGLIRDLRKVHLKKLETALGQARGNGRKAALRAQIRKATPNSDGIGGWTCKHFKMPFEKALYLVGSRRVLLRKGFAFVTEDDMFSVIHQRLRTHTRSLMNEFARLFTRYQSTEDPRMRAIRAAGWVRVRRGLERPIVAAAAAGTLTSAEDVDQLAKEHKLPPCIHNLLMHLDKNAHLKHYERRQLNLFLKAAGMPFKAALRFWFDKFASQLTKQVKYSFAHDYGLAGKRQNYRNHSCSRLMGEMPVTGQQNGCPFRIMGTDQLRKMLTRARVTNRDARENIVALAAGNQPSACRAACVATAKALGHTTMKTIDDPTEWLDAK